MILVKTTVRKTFDIVETEQDIKDKLKKAVKNEEYDKILDIFFKQGKMQKPIRKFEQDDVNWIYTSIIKYPDFETYRECFDHPAGRDIQQKVIEAGFEILVEIKDISELIKKR